MPLHAGRAVVDVHHRRPPMTADYTPAACPTTASLTIVSLSWCWADRQPRLDFFPTFCAKLPADDLGLCETHRHEILG